MVLAYSGNYWAAASGQEIGREISQRISAYYTWCGSSPLIRRMLLARRLIFGLENKQGATSWEVRRGGVQGELAKLRVGHVGNLVDQRVTLAMQQEPAWQPVATNSDFASLAQATSVSGVLDYYYRETRMERRLRKAADDMQWSGEGFVLGGWDARAGRVVAADPETGEAVTEGDLTFKSPNTLDVARDVKAPSWESVCSRSVRVFENKWDLMARHQEKADDIRGIDSEWFDLVSMRAESPEMESDLVPVFHWFHDKTDAMPEGRYVILLSRDVVLFDGPLPYRTSPLKRATEKELDGTPFGWTAAFDALGPQEVVDALTTAIVTQQTTNAVNKIVGVKGSGLNYKQLSQALAYLEVNSMEQAPKPLNFADVSPQVFEFRKALIQEMQMFLGINDIQRGVVNQNVKSGAHAALYDAIGLRASSRLQKAIHSLTEDVGTFILNTLADYAGDSERTARIMGENNRPMAVTFTGREMEGFDRVVVEATNHAGKTVVGKQAIADALLDKGALGQTEAAGHRYIQLLKTGELEQMTETPQAEALRRKRAKEMLAKGQPVAVLVTDRHWLDIPEYLTVLSSPEARENPQVVQTVLMTVQESLNLWRTMDVDLLALLGGPPPPSQAMAMTPPPVPGATTPTPGPGGGAQSSTPNPNQLPSPADQPTKPAGMPRMPGPDGGQEYSPDSSEVPIQ